MYVLNFVQKSRGMGSLIKAIGVVAGRTRLKCVSEE